MKKFQNAELARVTMTTTKDATMLNDQHILELQELLDAVDATLPELADRDYLKSLYEGDRAFIQCDAKLNLALRTIRTMRNEFAQALTMHRGEAVRYQRLTVEKGWIEVDDEDIEHYKSKGQEIRALYANPVSVTPVGDEWISVDDRLPEDGVQVLIFINEDEFVDIGTYSSKDTFCNGWDTNHDLSKYRDITHWMPLPKSCYP